MTPSTNNSSYRLGKIVAAVAIAALVAVPIAYGVRAQEHGAQAQEALDAKPADKSLGQKATDVVNGVKDRLGLGEPSSPASIYGHVEATDAAAGTFKISGVSGDFSAPSDVDITAFDGAEARVEVDAGGDVIRITQPDPEAPETPDKGLVGEIKDFVGMAGTTVIDGVMMTVEGDSRAFQINGLETTFVAPEDASVGNLDGHKVRVEVDSHGQVESISRHIGPDAEVGHEAPRTGS